MHHSDMTRLGIVVIVSATPSLHGKLPQINEARNLRSGLLREGRVEAPFTELVQERPVCVLALARGLCPPASELG